MDFKWRNPAIHGLWLEKMMPNVVPYMVFQVLEFFRLPKIKAIPP